MVKQETLKEVAERYVDSFEYSIAHPRRVAIKSFINGAKWQQERSYSEEDMKKAFINGMANVAINDFEFDVDTWFKQFKKK